MSFYLRHISITELKSNRNEISPVHSSDALFNYALHISEHMRILLDDGVGEIPTVVKYHVWLPWFLARLPGWSGDAAINAPPEIIFLFPLPSKYRVSCQFQLFFVKFIEQ